jgi:phytoene dehydrogenase-like protein
MPDGEFDGIIIGSGYNGLTLGGYLAKQGLKILVLERRMHYGGATITEEVTIPSVYHNLHANFTWSYGPPHQDFDLEKYGLKLMYGEVERCYLFDDGTTLTTYTDDPHRTYKQFKDVIGKADTDMLEEIFYRYLVKVEEEFYAPPKPNEERGAGLPDSERREYQRHCTMSGRDLLNELYQSDKLKTFIAVNACVRGNTDIYPGVGDFFLRYSASPKLSIIRGGNIPTRPFPGGLLSRQRRRYPQRQSRRANSGGGWPGHRCGTLRWTHLQSETVHRLRGGPARNVSQDDRRRIPARHHCRALRELGG